jgi:hypothetical protein
VSATNTKTEKSDHSEAKISHETKAPNVGEFRLFQTPIPEIDCLHVGEGFHKHNFVLNAKEPLVSFKQMECKADMVEILCDLVVTAKVEKPPLPKNAGSPLQRPLKPSIATMLNAVKLPFELPRRLFSQPWFPSFGIRVRSSSITYSARGQALHLSGIVEPHTVFLKTGANNYPRQMRIHMFVDKSLMEVFVNGGRQCATCVLDPDKGEGVEGIELFTDPDIAEDDQLEVLVKRLSVWPMKPVWDHSSTATT